MKFISNSALIGLALALIFSGCGRKESDSGSAAPVKAARPAKLDAAAETAPAVDPATPPPTPDAGSIAAPVAAVPQVDQPAVTDPNLLRFVQGAVESFLNGEGRNPKSFDELISRGYLKALPPAPPGKKFYFDPKDSSAKLVNQ